MKTPRDFQRDVLNFDALFGFGGASVLVSRVRFVGSSVASPRPFSSADARQFLVVFNVHNLELFGVHAGVGAE
jgi:hypothetical protein